MLFMDNHLELNEHENSCYNRDVKIESNATQRQNWPFVTFNDLWDRLVFTRNKHILIQCWCTGKFYMDKLDIKGTKKEKILIY